MNRADLSGAILRQAILTGALLRECDMTLAILTGADLRDTDVTASLMLYADLRNAVMSLFRSLSSIPITATLILGSILQFTSLIFADLHNKAMSSLHLHDRHPDALRN